MNGDWELTLSNANQPEITKEIDRLLFSRLKKVKINLEKHCQQSWTSSNKKRK